MLVVTSPSQLKVRFFLYLYCNRKPNTMFQILGFSFQNDFVFNFQSLIEMLFFFQQAPPLEVFFCIYNNKLIIRFFQGPPVPLQI